MLNPLLMDTSHLIGREQWREDMRRMLGPERKKVIIIEGPSGIGKTSELNRFAAQLLARNSHRPILCDFHTVDHIQGPDEALDVFFGTVFSALGYVLPSSSSFEERVLVFLEQIEKSSLPVVLFIDHAESLLGEQGKLAACWERFLSKFLRAQHRATLVISAKQWPGWFTGELRFLAEAPLSPLSVEQGVLLLQQLGLVGVPLPLLQAVHERVGGLPLCLEWVATLVQQPLFLGDGQGEHSSSLRDDRDGSMRPLVDPVQMLHHLIAERHIFGGVLAEDIAPLLEQRILSDYHLPKDVYQLLQVVSLSVVPLSQPALHILSPQWTRVIRVLRKASLLVAYPDRIQVLAGVASAIVRKLSPQERISQELLLIEAYKAWLKDGVFYENEKGEVVTELATLLLIHRQLLPAAEVLVRYGWLAFNMGYAVRLARLARPIWTEWDSWPEEKRQDQAMECGKWLLRYLLSPFLGEKINSAARAADYKCLLDRVVAGSVTIQPHTDLFVTRYLMLHYGMEQKRFVDAEHIVETCEQRLAHLIKSDPDLQASLLEKQESLFTNWCEHAENQADTQLAQKLRERAIAVCRTKQSGID